MSLPIDPEREYTKRELEQITGLARSTIYKKLEACGLSTSMRAYKGSELLKRFIPACGMLNGTATPKEVQQGFHLKKSDPLSSDDFYQQDEHSQDSSVVDAVSDEIAEVIRAIVVAGVQDLVPHIPHMVALALEEMAQTGAIREAFAQYRNTYLGTRSSINHRTPTLFATIEDVSETAEEPSVNSHAADAEEPSALDDEDELDDAWLSSDQ